MAFERIKTIRGHQYKYLVESVRIDGKVRQKILKSFGRVDKDPAVSNGVTIPYGLYYFSQDGCEACDSEDNVRRQVKDFLDDTITLNYINISNTANPINITVFGTPCVIYSGKDGRIYINTSLMMLFKVILGDDLFNSKRSIKPETQKKARKSKKCKDGVCQV